jgi:hypothetical protein
MMRGTVFITDDMRSMKADILKKLMVEKGVGVGFREARKRAEGPPKLISEEFILPLPFPLLSVILPRKRVSA